MSKIESTDTSMDIHSAAYDDVFRRWKSARTTLTRAISEYLAISAELCEVLSTTACHSSSRFLLEQALSGIDLELSSLQSEEEQLKQTRTTLANERNTSRVLSPVHKLPPEILATIFVVATNRYTRHDRTASDRTHSSPVDVSSVSSSWRQIALGTPSLWSYIDLIVGGDSYPDNDKQAELWVKRSCNTVLYIDIQEHQSSFTQDTVLGCHVTDLLRFLAPLMHRVHVLEMSGPLQAHNMLSSVLALWAEHTSTDIKKTLQIVNNHFDQNSNAALGPASDGSFSADEFNSFFRSFNRLLVRNYRISESVVFHEGLVELHLESIDTPRSPTQRELVAMLATAPRLRILVLANCWIEPSDEIPTPATLNHLQFLSLESETNSHGFAHVFPLLTIGSESLSMSLTLGDDPDLIAEARAFFGRTKVTQLYAWGVHENAPLSALLYPIPHLETLALDYFDITGEIPQRFFDFNADGRSTVPWPRLRTLYMEDPVVDLSCLQLLIQLHRSLKNLHLYRARIDGERRSLISEDCDRLVESIHMVGDIEIELEWRSHTIQTWDFVILTPY